MLLKDFDFPPIITTSTHNIIDDFFIPALDRSIKYDRGVGFFSSGWFRIAAKGMANFAQNGGHARWVTSPILDEDDWNAMLEGEFARQDIVLYQILKKNIEDLVRSLESDTLSAISWMIADGCIEFKLAIPRNKLDHGEFHDKFGVFTDINDNMISFNGSYNDSIQGTHNYESIKVFCSWNPPFVPLVHNDMERFNDLWENRDPNVQVFDVPSAAKEMILKLRTNERPYHKVIRATLGSPISPEIPADVKLRDYQESAINSWINNNYHGIFEMATGTGKTITSLAAIVRLRDVKQKLILVIVVPYKHLVEQWSLEAEKFGFRPIRVAESAREWEPELSRQSQAFRLGLTNSFSLVATNSALESGKLSSILNGVWPFVVLIVDEVHHAGAPGMQKALPREIPWRLGLSATPIRHYDELGSEAIVQYFGEIVFKFGLDEAIGKFLTPYYYYPTPVEMTDDEFQEYCELTSLLGKYIHSSESEMPDAAKKIAIKRARVLNNSTNKLKWLSENIVKYQKQQFTLFYVGESLFIPVKHLLGIEKRLRIHEFTQRQNNAERSEILNLFSKGELQALIAMKCLDEGVDVPPTREAYFLASSGNPREFIQRRGRVLRLFPGKDYAIIRDLISIPPMEFIDAGISHPNYSAIRSSFLREYRRVKEFANLAINHFQALAPMFEIAQKLELLDE